MVHGGWLGLLSIQGPLKLSVVPNDPVCMCSAPLRRGPSNKAPLLESDFAVGSEGLWPRATLPLGRIQHAPNQRNVCEILCIQILQLPPEWPLTIHRGIERTIHA
jgi:hypothetical protein